MEAASKPATPAKPLSLKKKHISSEKKQLADYLNDLEISLSSKIEASSQLHISALRSENDRRRAESERILRENKELRELNASLMAKMEEREVSSRRENEELREQNASLMARVEELVAIVNSSSPPVPVAPVSPEPPPAAR